MKSEAVSLRRKFSDVWALLDERSRHLMAASEACSLGYGGVSTVSRAWGLSRKAIAKRMREISAGDTQGMDAFAEQARVARKSPCATPSCLPHGKN